MLLSFLRQEFERCKDNAFEERRKICLERYQGEPFGNEVAGRSTLVTRDVMEKCNSMTVSVMDTIISGERIVDFESDDPQQNEVLKLAGRVVHENFFRRQNGFRIVDECLKSGLIEIIGAAMSYYEKDRNTQRVLVDSDEALAAIIAQVGEDIELEEAEDGLYAVWDEPRYKFGNLFIPNEELHVSQDAKSLQEASYICHLAKKTISDLRAMGFDVDDYDSDDYSSYRDPGRDAKTGYGREERTGAQRSVSVYHEFVKYDYDGDGIAEMRQIIRLGSKILHNEEIDFCLFEEWCPFPLAGRRIGESLAEKIIPIEKARSFLLRETLDNYALSNRPRVMIGLDSERDDGVTMDDLLNHSIGHPIRYAGMPPQILTIPFTAANSFQGMEFLAGEAESYSGITRLNQGLDRDALNKTATGTAMMQAQGQQIELYVARQFAEFLGRLFVINYRLLQRFGEVQTFMVDGKPQEVDPKQWPDVFTVTPRTGLGSGKKETRAQARMQLLQIQREGMMAGLPITPEHLFYNINGLVQDLGLGEGRNYWPNADEAAQATQQEQKPDPEQQKLEMDMQVKQKKAEMDAQLAEAKAQADLDLMREKAQFEAELAEEKAFAEMQMARDKMAQEMELAREQMLQDYALEKESIRMGLTVKAKRSEADDDDTPLGSNRPGGDLSK
jgi:hypothetical protein